jgi:hypothetical protein
VKAAGGVIEWFDLRRCAAGGCFVSDDLLQVFDATREGGTPSSLTP